MLVHQLVEASPAEDDLDEGGLRLPFLRVDERELDRRELHSADRAVVMQASCVSARLLAGP